LPETRSWYDIRAAAKGETDVYLYDEIGFFGITAQSFVDALNAVKTKVINLFVNSPGGDVADGTAIYNALKRNSATINATVDGIAASAASFIIQAADKISMGKGSTMMIHEPWGLAVGDAANMRKMAEELDVFAENIAEIYADRAGGTPEDWRVKMVEETWYKAQAAVDAGLADELVGVTKATDLVAGRVFNLSKFRHVPDWVPNAAGTAFPATTRLELTPVPPEIPQIVAPDPVSVVRSMNIPPAAKRRAIAHLKAVAAA
jgi:ATP-dependent Clp endopeptidase proteolytic subunit ClpP